MKDKYGFKTYGNNGLENYTASNVITNANRYLPKYKKVASSNSVSDLFKDNRTQAQKEQDAFRDRLNAMENKKVSKEMLMSAEELELLSNSNQLDQLFNGSVATFVTSLDNAECKDAVRNYGTKGVYIVNMKNEDVFFNKVSRIEKLDYIPGCILKKSNYNYKHTAYNIYTKHASGTDVLVTRLVFATY